MKYAGWRGPSGMKKLILLSVIVLSIASAHDFTPVLADTKRSPGRSPTAEIISPRKGEIVRGKITIQARVGDPSKVDHLDFYFQEPGAEDRYGWKDYSSPYFWGGDAQMLDTTLFDDGPASAVVGCYPRDSRLSMKTDRVHFTIDNGKPKARILSPRGQASVAGDVSIEVDAEDPKGVEKRPGIAAVYIYVDGSLLRKLSEKPFRAKMDTCLLAPGLHSVRAVAEDSEGMTSANMVMITVNPAASALEAVR